MAVTAGEIGLDLVINKKQYDKQLKGITGMAKKAGAALAAAFTVKKLVDFGKECIELGSDLAEVQNVVDVTFPKMTAQVDKFAKSAAASFGLSETMAKKFTGTFGAMAKAFGFSESAAYEMSTTLTGLAGDVASFYNITQDEAYTKLKSVFTGETESLKDLGVVMTQSALDAFALANGFGKTTSAMSEAEKVALRYAFVQDRLNAASGDFARTADSWANQVRILKLQFDSLRATIGQGLINVLTPVIKVINTVIGKLMTLANAFKAFTELITGKKSPGAQVAGTGAAAKESLNGAAGAADNLSAATGGVGKAAKKAAKEMRALMGFDQINKLDDKSDSDSGSSGGSGGGAGGAAMDFGSGALAEMDSATNEFSAKMEGYFNKIKDAIEPTITSLKRLWNEGLSKLGAFTWQALKDFYNGFLVPVGKWVLGTGLPRFIDALNNGLMKINFDKINKALKGLWDALTPFAINIGEGLLWFWENVLVPFGTWTANEVVPRFLDTLAAAITVLNNVINALKPLFQWFWDSILKPMANWAADAFLAAWDGINSALTAFGNWCTEHSEIIQQIAVLVGSFAAAWGLVNLAVGIWGGICGIATAATSAFGVAVNFLLSPIGMVVVAITALIAVGVLIYKNWDTIKEKAAELWQGIKDIFSGIADWFKGKFDAAREAVFKAFSGVTSWFKERYKDITNAFNGIGEWFSKKFQSAYKAIKSVFSGIGKWFKKRYDDITGVFSGIAGWFKGKFDAAWGAIKGAFSGVGSFFKGLWKKIVGCFTNVGTKIGNAVGGAFKKAINSVFKTVENIVNGFIKTINGVIGIINEIPGVKIGKIKTVSLPRLANGGYVKANTPQLAMIGDNRHQGEVVAPEDKLKEMALEAAKMAGNSGDYSREILNVLIQILDVLKALDLDIVIDGKKLKDIIVKKINQHTVATGVCEIIT